MTPPIKRHPDGRAVLRVFPDDAPRPWVAVWANADTYSLDVEIFSDDEARDWPVIA